MIFRKLLFDEVVPRPTDKAYDGNRERLRPPPTITLNRQFDAAIGLGSLKTNPLRHVSEAMMLLAIIFGAVGVIIFAWVIWTLWHLHGSFPNGNERQSLNIQLLAGVGQILGAFGTCIGLIYAGQQLSQSRTQYFEERQSKEASEINQRISETIKDMGSDAPIIREGALLRLRFLYEQGASVESSQAVKASTDKISLVQEASNSPIKREDILLLLVGFIRLHATRSAFETTKHDQQLWPPPDVMTAIKLLSHINDAHSARLGPAGTPMLLDLSGICLAEVDFTSFEEVINMSHWRLDNADFRESNLDHCHFIGTSFACADLTNATLRNATLSGGVNLSGAKLGKADFSNVILDEADLSNVDLTNCQNLPAGPFRNQRVLVDDHTELPPNVEHRENKQKQAP